MMKTQETLLRNKDKVEWIENLIFLPMYDAEILLAIEREIKKAETKFPDWPRDLIYGQAILNEECGEAQKEVNHIVFGEAEASLESLQNELTQTAAMAIRFLLAIKRIKRVGKDKG